MQKLGPFLINITGGELKVTRVTFVVIFVNKCTWQICHLSVMGDRNRIQQSALVRININIHRPYSNC